MEEHIQKKSFWRRLFRQEHQLLQLGPFRLVRNPWQHVALGWALAITMLVMIFSNENLFHGKAMENLGIWQYTLLLKVLAIVVGLLFTFRIKLRGKPGFFISTVLFIAAPFAAFYMVEFLNDVKAYDREPEYVFMNILAYAAVYLLFLLIFGNYRWSIFSGTVLFYAFALACYFVLAFRGTPFVPLDILSSGTAANVATNYSFEATPQWIGATVQAGLIAGIGFQLGRGNLKRRRWKMTLRGVAALFILVTVGTFFSQSHLNEKGYIIVYWNQQISYEEYGNWFAFCINMRSITPEKSEGYNAVTISKTIDSFLEKKGVDPDGDTSYNMLTGKNDYKASDGKQPNIVVIMNESFSDLQSKGKGFKTNEEVMPFFKSLKENTVRGNLQVSVTGGGTACTEYEVLTGNAQRFLPSGSVAYSANIHSSTPSLVWNLLDQGYQTEAFHPYRGSGWNRNRVYPYLGFESDTFLEDYIPDEMTFDEAWCKKAEATDPKDGNVLNRLYMSDHYDFKILRERFEDRDKSKPFFFFNVTMQNHGSYDASYPNFEEKIKIEGMNGSYPMAERYLSLVNATDEAFKELITYFKEDVKEPTIVVMFGDHIPSVDNGFYEELYGTKKINDLNATEAQERYQTPFVIWANYDIPEKDMGNVSANYLSTLIQQVAGSELTPYNRYLASLYSEVPVISSIGFEDKDGICYRYAKSLDNEDDVNAYQCIAYNNLLGNAHRDWSAFTIDGEPLPDVEVKARD